MKTRQSQEQIVINRLINKGKIDNFWCLNNYILRLGAYICILKKDGWKIVRNYGKGKDRKNSIYTLVSRPKK